MVPMAPSKTRMRSAKAWAKMEAEAGAVMRSF
jgi:hypothetical protein